MINRRNFLKTTIVGAVASFVPSALLAENNEKLPNVLILGDSISIGYTPFVRDMLKGKANVYRPLYPNGKAENCEGTTKGKEMMEEWLSANKWDIIHFNFGLHDLKHVDEKTGKNSTNPDDPQQAGLKTYKKNLKEIVEKLNVTGATLVFATTTPFPDKPKGPLRRADQPKKYNKVALKIMKKYDIRINNLHDFVLPRMEELQLPSNVHFKKAGSEALAKQVVKHIEELL
ncbi:GDSL-type esterase/lipase family protein [Saccharicrinis sp. 156]|uniref:GDSL-type esterase/lipase family protein n=1 Tax=Saccharicrinis sp. 156 TaxID=3417574 RepID=UPI003D344619